MIVTGQPTWCHKVQRSATDCICHLLVACSAQHCQRHAHRLHRWCRCCAEPMQSFCRPLQAYVGLCWTPCIGSRGSIDMLRHFVPHHIFAPSSEAPSSKAPRFGRGLCFCILILEKLMLPMLPMQMPSRGPFSAPLACIGLHRSAYVLHTSA